MKVFFIYFRFIFHRMLVVKSNKTLLFRIIVQGKNYYYQSINPVVMVDSHVKLQFNRLVLRGEYSVHKNGSDT